MVEALCWDVKYVSNSLYIFLCFAQTEKFLKLLKEEEGIKGLLTMAQSGNIDIIAQVARGMANFAKCETREIMQGYYAVFTIVAYTIYLKEMHNQVNHYNTLSDLMHFRA